MSRTSAGTYLLVGLAAGSGLMYLLDHVGESPRCPVEEERNQFGLPVFSSKTVAECPLLSSRTRQDQPDEFELLAST